MIKKVAIFGQTHSVNAEKEIKILLLALEKHNVVAIFEENFYNALKDSFQLTKKYYLLLQRFNWTNSSYYCSF